MIINRTNVEAVFQNLRASYNQAFAGTQAATNWQSVATEQSTTSIVELMAWIQDLPNWREWAGDKVIEALAAYGYTLTLLPYETTFGVKRRDLEADRLGIYAAKARANGELAAYYPQERVFDLLNAAFTAPCFDGQAFFSDAHPTETKAGKATTFTNKLVVPLSSATKAAAAASLGAAEIALMGMKNSRGRPIRISSPKLVVPLALKATAWDLYNSDRLEDGKSNPFKGQYEPEVCQDLTSPTAWFLAGSSGGLKPLIHMVRKSPTTVQVMDPSDSYVVTTGNFIFGQEADSAAGFTLPQLAVGSTGAG